MKRGEIRDAQLANLIAEELDYILSSANDARLRELTVTAVSPKPGGGHFVVCLAPMDGCDHVIACHELKLLLKKAAPFIRAELTSVMSFKRTPYLTLMPDPLFDWQ